MDDATFLRAARTSGEARERVGDQAMMVRVEDWLRLVGMAERWREEHDHDADRYPTARLGQKLAPVDADDCAPGLESLYDAMVSAADREAPCPKCSSPGGPFTGFGLAGGGFGFYAGCADCGAFEKHQTSDDPPDDVDCDRPGDDLTRETFDAMDGEKA